LQQTYQLRYSDHAILATLRARQNDLAAAWTAALSALTYGRWASFRCRHQQSLSIIHQGTHWNQQVISGVEGRASVMLEGALW